MSKKTSFLRKIFNRVGRDGLRRRKSRRPEAHVEQLEKRIALAVDVVTGAQGGNGEQWLSVLANDGSDVYMTMRTQDLLISDNSSFTPSSASTVEVAAVDANYETVYVYNGSLVDQQVKFPNDSGYSPDYGLLPTSYPTANTQQLSFLINTEFVDQSEAITGSIQLGDVDGTVLNFTGGDGAEWEFVGVSTALDVSIGISGGLTLITLDSAVLAGAGARAMPILTLNFDRVPQLGTAIVTAGGGVAPQSSSSVFNLFDATTHQYVPGSLEGELAIYAAGYNGPQSPRPISFQVETTGTGVVPISFGDVSNTQWSGARSLSTSIPASVFTGTNQLGGRTISISGEFHTETGELFFNANINGSPVRMPLHIDNLRIGLRDLTPADDPADVLGTRFDNFPNDLTLFAGSTFTRSVIAELPNTASEISIENPLIVAAGTNGGRVSLSAGKVTVNSGIRASGQFVIPSATTTSFGTSSEIVTINAPVGSPSFDIRLDDNEATGNFIRSRFEMSRQGSLSDLGNILTAPPATLPPADEVYLEVEDGDAFITGTISADEHSYVMRSGVGSEVEGPYVLTTASDVTGVQTGEIVGQTLSMLLANDTLGENFQSYQTMVSTVDIHTSVDRLRMQAATRQGHSADFPFPYDITIRESDNLIVDAVSSSSGKIDIEAEGALTFLSAVNSMGDIKLESGDDFVVSAPISTSFGSIDISGPQVNVANSVRINGRVSSLSQNDIIIAATNGQLLLADAVAAINGVKLAALGANGSISGDGRVIGDTIGAESTGDIVIRTNANGISARTPGVVRLEDQTAAAFEIFDSPDVSLTANGLDDVVTFADGTKGVSSALYADVAGALKIAVSAPQGSIDVLHSGTAELELGDGAAIASGVDVGVMTAGGSVVVRSSTAREMVVSDAPSATSGATTVRFMTSQPLPPATSFQPSARPGVYPTILTTSLPMNADKSVDILGGIVATDIKRGDLLLSKDGMATYSVEGFQQWSSPSEILMPTSFDLGDGSILDKRIQGRSFEEDTLILDYNEDTRLLQLSKPVISSVVPSDLVHIFDSDANYSNGIYGVVDVMYESSDSVLLTLRRASGFDTTDEISGRRYIKVTDGAMSGSHSSAGKVFASQGFSNSNSTTTPLVVKPVLSSPGFVTANAISTRTLPAALTDNGDIRATENGSIGFDADFFDGVVLGINRTVLIQSPLTTASTTAHYGVYEVVSSGDTGSPWRLRRYSGVDENGDGQINQFLTGKVALTQGSLRTAITGMMYEIGFDSLNNANLEFKEITDFRHVDTKAGGTYVTETYDSLGQYRTDIGTRNVLGRVTYQITSEVGDNDSPGSLGRILNILQGNTASVDRIGEAQLTETTFHDSVQKIQLDQELPEITSPIFLTPSSEIIIDGSRIARTRDGAVVRSGALRSRLGPVSPSASPSARRLVRGAGQEIDFERVSGLEIAPGGKGSIIQNLSIGGFSNGAGIAIIGADNVLLNNVRVGVDEAGNQMPNAVGIQVDQVAGGENARFTTVRNSTIAANFEAGISLGTNVDGVRIVGSQIGQDDVEFAGQLGGGNEAGVIFDSGENGTSHLGVRRITPALPVTNLQVTPLESSEGGLPGEALPELGDPAPTSRVSVAKSLTTDFFEPGLQLFDRTTNRMWTVRKIELATDELNYVMTIQGPQIDEASVGLPLALEASYFVNATRRSETLLLPPGVDPARLYLGQGLASTVPGVIEIETYITSITIPPRDPGLPQDAGRFGFYGGVEIGLSKPLANSAQTGLLFQGADRNLVARNNDGVILKSGSSSIVSTDVAYSNFDGIRVEGVASKIIETTGNVPNPSAPNPEQITNVAGIAQLTVGMTVTGANIPTGATITGIDSSTNTLTLSTPVTTGAGFQSTPLVFMARGTHMIGGASGIELSSENVTVYANLASGLSFTESFFADLADGESKQERFNQVKIRGNVFGTDFANIDNDTTVLANGRTGENNILIADVSMQYEHQGSEDRDSVTGRRIARYRPEDNPNNLEELKDFVGLDIEGNAHRTGDPAENFTVTGPLGRNNGYYTDRALPMPPTLR